MNDELQRRLDELMVRIRADGENLPLERLREMFKLWDDIIKEDILSDMREGRDPRQRSSPGPGSHEFMEWMKAVLRGPS